eukprot:GHVQ01003747.1.p1 GENE.GHVQ01003747.1~~GHVQ01003747.1.p1  ORF type:complete len:576 (-),score=87.10 GHVQ01003747.1:695-2422(-)
MEHVTETTATHTSTVLEASSNHKTLSSLRKKDPPTFQSQQSKPPGSSDWHRRWSILCNATRDVGREMTESLREVSRDVQSREITENIKSSADGLKKSATQWWQEHHPTITQPDSTISLSSSAQASSRPVRVCSQDSRHMSYSNEDDELQGQDIRDHFPVAPSLSDSSSSSFQLAHQSTLTDRLKELGGKAAVKAKSAAAVASEKATSVSQSERTQEFVRKARTLEAHSKDLLSSFLFPTQDRQERRSSSFDGPRSTLVDDAASDDSLAGVSPTELLKKKEGPPPSNILSTAPSPMEESTFKLEPSDNSDSIFEIGDSDVESNSGERTPAQEQKPEKKGDWIELMQHYQQHVHAIEKLESKMALNLTRLKKLIGDTQVYEVYEIRCRQQRLNKFVPVQVDAEVRLHRYIVLCLNQIMVVERHTPRDTDSGLAEGTDSVGSPCTSSPRGVDTSSQLGDQMSVWMKSFQDKALDAWKTARTANGGDVTPGTSKGTYENEDGIVDMGNKDCWCIIKSNHRIQSLSKITLQEGRTDRIDIGYKRGKVNTYDMPAHETFLISLKGRLACLNVGMKISMEDT